MKSKFNIGDEIYFMNYDTPSKGIIQGIAFIMGDFKSVNFSRKSDGDKPAIVYSMDGYAIVNERGAFKSSEELKDSLFKNL